MDALFCRPMLPVKGILIVVSCLLFSESTRNNTGAQHRYYECAGLVETHLC
jgi:hypothetical protein